MRARLEGAWEGLTARERRLVAALGAVAGALVLLAIVYLPSRAIAALEAENDAIEGVLRDIDRAGERLAAREAERAAAERRYDVRAPALGSFIEAQAGELGLTLQQVTDQPEVQEGRFRRRHVRARVPSTSLRSAVRLMSALESEPYPIALERVHVEHFRGGEDAFDVELGIVTYDREGAGRDGADAGVGGAAAASPSTGRAGPPPPPR